MTYRGNNSDNTRAVIKVITHTLLYFPLTLRVAASFCGEQLTSSSYSQSTRVAMLVSTLLFIQENMLPFGPNHAATTV